MQLSLLLLAKRQENSRVSETRQAGPGQAKERAPLNSIGFIFHWAFIMHKRAHTGSWFLTQYRNIVLWFFICYWCMEIPSPPTVPYKVCRETPYPESFSRKEARRKESVCYLVSYRKKWVWNCSSQAFLGNCYLPSLFYLYLYLCILKKTFPTHRSHSIQSYSGFAPLTSKGPFSLKLQIRGLQLCRLYRRSVGNIDFKEWTFPTCKQHASFALLSVPFWFGTCNLNSIPKRTRKLCRKVQFNLWVVTIA